MSKKVYLGIALAMSLASCTNEDYTDFNVESKLEATVENTAFSRVGFDKESQWSFFWHNGDRIWVNESPMKTEDADKSKTATFTGYGVNTSSGYAIYPFDGAEDNVNNNVLTWNFPTTYSYDDIDNEFFKSSQDVPMYAEVENGSASFKHLSAVAVFKVNGWELVGEHVFTLTASKKITGEFTADLTSDVPEFTTTEEVTDQVTIEYNRPENAGTGDIVFYVPVPTGTYDISFKLKVNGQTELAKSYKGINVKRADVVWAEFGESTLVGGSGVVASEESLKTALAEGGEVTLSSPIELTEPLNVSENTVLDLNGQVLNVGENTINVSEGATLMLKNSSTSVFARSTSEVSSSIIGSGDIITAAKNSKITIEEGVSLTNTGGNCCIFVPRGAENVTVNTAGNLLVTKEGYATIYVNGYVTSGTINVIGGSVKQEKDVAIFISGNADLNISGNAEIEGTSAVEFRAGKLTIDGGVFTATASPLNVEGNGNGTTTTGAAIAISQHSTNYDINVNIKGGEFNGYYALNETDAEDDSSDNIIMSVTGGTFNGGIGSENCSSFITGGTFSDPSAFEYLAEGANVTVGANWTLTKSIIITQDATVNLNGKNITCNDADVFEVISGTLTLEDEGNNAVVWGSSDNSHSSCAVWARENGSVIINGGTYQVGDDETGKPDNWRNDCIYAKDNAKITINGGKFQYTGVNEIGHTFLLNCKDADYKAGKCSITVNGGSFYKFNPGTSNGENPVANFLGEGHTSVQDGEWYTVQ